MDKVWIVSFDGYLGGYGSYEYLLGVYDDKNLAFEAAENLIKQYSQIEQLVSIQEVTINKTLSIRDDKLEDWDELFTDVCLGGYAE